MTPFSLLPDVSGAAWLPVADAILKATLLLGVAALASHALRRQAAAVRHMVWTLALLSAMALPVLSIALPRWQVPLVTLPSTASTPVQTDASPTSDKAPAFRANREAQPAAPSTVAPAPFANASLPGMSWSAALLLIWAFGAAMILGRLALGLAAVQWMSRRTAQVTNAPWLPLARELATQVGVSPRILFLRSNRAAMPMAWGMFLPSVLMPADADRWPADRLRIVLLHELAHVKRRDCLTHVLAQVTCALYWFNPLAWMAARHVRTERERACDNLVLASGTRGPEDADQLLEIARETRAGRFPGVMAGASLAMAHRSQLEGRLMAILDPTVPRSGMSRVRTAAATIAFACAVMPLAAMQPWTYADNPKATADLGVHDPQARPEPQVDVRVATRVDTRTQVATNRNVSVRDRVRGGSVDGIVDGVVEGIVTPTVYAVLESMGVTQERIADAAKTGKADPRTIAALTAALKDADKEVRETALHALVQLRDPGIFEPLIQALTDATADVREQAAFGLGQLRDRRAVEPLVAALKDRNADVREQVAFALGQLRDRSAAGPLSGMLKDIDADVREQVVFALGQLRDVAALEGLSAALHDQIPNVREQAAFSLGQIRDPKAVQPLVSALKDSNADVREQAAFALGQIRDRSAVEALIIALKDSDADVREQAAFALGRLRDPRAIDGLTAALKDSSADVRQQAAFALGQIAR